MKKTGILTFHFADNFGAVLQSYALYKTIQDMNICEAEIIDFIPAAFQYEQRWCNSYEKKLFYKKRESFNSFLSQNCKLSDRCNSLRNTTYDLYCVGSDQVWNTEGVFVDYFLSNIPDEKKRISFASSVALSNNSPYLRKDLFEKYISKFDYISVREEESVEFIKRATKKDCRRVCDPTVLLDSKNYENLFEETHVKNKYILFFWLLNDSNVYAGIEFVNRLSRKCGIPIIHSLYGNYQNYIVNNYGTMFFSSPGQFLKYIKDAEYVVTNSYHASLFSLMFEKKIYIFLVNKMRTRFETLSNLYEMDDCIIDNYLLNGIEDSQINYKKINVQMEKEKNKGRSYLKESIERLVIK